MSKRMLELFSGSGIMAETFREHGWEVMTVDSNPEMGADIVRNIVEIEEEFIGFDVIWASPPCQTFSVASISTHWTGGKGAYVPKTERCVSALGLVEATIRVIMRNGPKHWYIENPRGVLRKIIDKMFEEYKVKDYKRVTVTYCQYGDTRMKPTDIWTNNMDWRPRPMCKNGDPCHVRAPRGSKTGTQGLKGAYERGKLPKELCREIEKEADK